MRMHLNAVSNHNTPLRVSFQIAPEVARVLIRVRFYYRVWCICWRSGWIREVVELVGRIIVAILRAILFYAADAACADLSVCDLRGAARADE